jgi:hypothetical protein
MTNELADRVDRSPALPAILLAYLDGVAAPALPGGDGLTLDDVLSCYPGAVVAGQVPDRRQLCARHPELAGEVDAFFTRLGATTQ